jgi:ribulose-5-phosphate 4-epimerase/fuculose-1-phosphate aldolase
MISPSCQTADHIRRELAAAYQMLALLSMDDLTYTHLSARAPDDNSFYIYPFGLLFEEVTASCLLRVSLDGEVLEGSEFQYNCTGYIIHGHIYQARSDIQAIFHFHTPAGVAVSAHPQGLLPLSQWALHFYNRIAYHAYDSLALVGTQGQQLIADLAAYKALLMRHHGTLTCGSTLQEAFFYAYHLEQACKTQCLMLGQNANIPLLPPAICEKTVGDLLGFEKDLGRRDWQAMLRKLDRLGIKYDD